MQTTSGGYTIQLNQAAKTFDIAIRGSFTPEQAKAFHEDYQTKVGSIQANDYVLRVDSKDMNIITQDMLPKLEISFTMYKHSNFKAIEVEIMSSAVIKMQLNRVARTVGLANFSIIEY